MPIYDDDQYESNYFPRSGPLDADGIKAQSQRGPIGESWWSERFVTLLEAHAHSGRLSRGRHYARRGQVLRLRINAGEVEARVQGSRRRPYDVRLSIRPFSPDEWETIEQTLFSQALFLADLLAGELTKDAVYAIEEAGIELLPYLESDLKSYCSCPDPVSPCKHAAAVVYLFAEALDRDPFNVFTFRGRSKDELIAGLRRRRGVSDAGGEDGEVRPQPQRRQERIGDFYRPSSDLSSLSYDFEPHDATAMVAQLPVPAFQVAGQNPLELLAPLYTAMAAEARGEALGEAAEPQAAENAASTDSE